MIKTITKKGITTIQTKGTLGDVMAEVMTLVYQLRESLKRHTSKEDLETFDELLLTFAKNPERFKEDWDSAGITKAD